MSSSDSVIFLTDTATYPLLRQVLLAREDVHLVSSGVSASSSPADEDVPGRIQASTSTRHEVLHHSIDNKYYSAEISLHLFCFEHESSSSAERIPSQDGPDRRENSLEVIKTADLSSWEKDVTQQFDALCNPGPGAQVFIWAFSDDSLRNLSPSDLPKPRPKQLGLILADQPSRELNYALYLSPDLESSERIKGFEAFDETGWEVLVHALNPRGGSKQDNGNEGASDEEEVDMEAEDEDGLGVIFDGLQTVMWEGMTKKPRNEHRPSRYRIEQNQTVQGTGLSGSVSEEQREVERKQVVDRDLADSEKMADDLEGWLNDDAGLLVMPRRTEPSVVPGAGGFEDDFGPFRSSASQAEHLPNMELDPDLDLDEQVNLEAILDQLNRTRQELGTVENEDERRVRAGKEVERLLGLIGMDLGDDDGHNQETIDELDEEGRIWPN